MQGLKNENNKMLKQDLLKNIILGNGQTIWQIDILNTCITSEDKSNDFFESIINWINSHVQNKVSKEDVEKYNFEINYLSDEYFPTEQAAESVEYVVINKHIAKESVINLKGIVFLAAFFIILLLLYFN